MSQLLQFYRSFQNRNSISSSQPTFEDLSIDASLSEIQRFVKYVKSSIALQRLVHVKMLHEIAVSVGFEESKIIIIPLLDALSKDGEPAVKQHLAEQLILLAKFCCQSGSEEGYALFISSLLPIIARLLEDGKPEVRQSACNTLKLTSPLIRQTDLGQNLLTIILRLAHEDDKEEMRMTASELLNSLVDVLGPDLCKQFVIPELVSLAEDPAFRVRKSAALNFHNICREGGEHELFERLMPAFVRLSKDDVFRVRRACAESLCEISKYVSDDIRIGVLVEIFLRLMHDPSKPVKHSVLQQSGMFISTLPSRAITETILEHYCNLANDPTNDPIYDAELKHCCAFCFPGVFQALGASRWSELRNVYQSLAQCRIVTVKQTLAHSLHEVAKIFGEESLVEEELVPVFEEMIQDVESVQIGVIKYLADFLSLLSEPCRISYLPLLHDILHSTNPFNWRLRQCLAVQLPELVHLPPVDNLCDSLFPLVMTLLQDPVSCVRKDSYKGISTMIALLAADVKANQDDTANDHANSQHFKSIIATINTLIRGETFQMRQLWVELCHRFLFELPRDIIEVHFVHGIVVLANDPVCNVRVTVATLLSGWEPSFEPSSINSESIQSNSNAPSSNSGSNTLPKSNWTWLLQRSDILESVQNLSQDDRDVYTSIVKLQPAYPDVVFSIIKRKEVKKMEADQLGIINIDSLEIGSIGSPIDITRDLISPSRLHTFSDNWESFVSDSQVVGPNLLDLPNIDGLPDEILEQEKQSILHHVEKISLDDDHDEDIIDTTNEADAIAPSETQTTETISEEK